MYPPNDIIALPSHALHVFRIIYNTVEILITGLTMYSGPVVGRVVCKQLVNLIRVKCSQIIALVYGYTAPTDPLNEVRTHFQTLFH